MGAGDRNLQGVTVSAELSAWGWLGPRWAVHVLPCSHFSSWGNLEVCPPFLGHICLYGLRCPSVLWKSPAHLAEGALAYPVFEACVLSLSPKVVVCSFWGGGESH